MWEVYHLFCKEMCWKLLKYGDLRSAPSKKPKKKEIFKLRSLAHEVKISRLAWTGGSQKFVHCIRMKYFGFIDVLRTVGKEEQKKQSLIKYLGNFSIQTFIKRVDYKLLCSYIVISNVHNIRNL